RPRSRRRRLRWFPISPSARAPTYRPPPVRGGRGGSVPQVIPTLPNRTRIYRHHHLDSTRWDAVRQRPGDIVVSTSAKAGTPLRGLHRRLVRGAGRRDVLPEED